MKNSYLPEAKNDNIYAFIGDVDATVLVLCGVIVIVLTAMIILMICKRREGGK